MKTKFLIPVLAIFSLLFSSFTMEENNKIYGEWWTPEKKAKIKIYKATSGKTCGKIIWLKDPKDSNGNLKKDENNPDESKRSETIINLVFLKNFVYQGDNEWEDGTIYDANNGKTYNCNLILEDDNTLNVRGYIGFSFIGRSEKFTRVVK